MTFTVRATVGLALAAVVALSLGAVTAQAQKPQSGTEFYLAYKAAFDKATKIEDIYPFMAASRLAEMKATPAEDRKMMFEMIKTHGRHDRREGAEGNPDGHRRDTRCRRRRRGQVEADRHHHAREGSRRVEGRQGELEVLASRACRENDTTNSSFRVGSR